MAKTRVRFCPSPTGNPHVGLVRTALFNWAYARHTGGDFVFRIEDTDAQRDSEESYEQLLEALTWLGLTWDEGPQVGGPHGPYRQSERGEIYQDAIAKLVAADLVYESFATAEEVKARRQAHGENPQLGYDNRDRELTQEQKAAFRAEGRLPVLRLRMPERTWSWDDLVRGTISVGAEQVPDFVLVRNTGAPLYTLVNPLDDVLMGVTHVLRGEDLLSSTPRQLALVEALGQVGIGDGQPPRYGHLPYVMGEGNKKLSKRDPESNLNFYRKDGFLPEGLLNYLALLGWSPGDDQEFFSLTEMAKVFDVERVNPNPARFDIKKCTAINAQWVRHLDPADLSQRLQEHCVAEGLLAEPVSQELADMVRAGTPLVQERMETLAQGAAMLEFLLVPEADFVIDPDEAKKVLTEQAAPVLAAGEQALAALETWDTPAIEAALRQALIEELGLKPRLAFGPIRVAISGRRVSPPLFESLELLGPERSLARIRAAAALTV